VSQEIKLIVEQQPDDNCYRVCWCDGEPYWREANIPEILLDLVPYMVARKLLSTGYRPDRILIVKLQGADYELMHAPLGIVAATPVLNDKPVTESTRSLYLKRRNHEASK
jgi:hypothetical protein